MNKKLTNKQKNTIIFCIFFGLLTIFQIIMYISAKKSEGYSMNSIIFNYYTDSFMDFFNTLNVSILKNPFDTANIGEYSLYSPLYVIMFKVFSSFSNTEVYGYDKSYYTHFSETLLIYMMFCVITISALSILIYNTKKGNKIVKIWFLLLCLLSAPMLYNVERGNIIIIALISLFVFILNYQREEKNIRHLSLIALSLGVAIKPLMIVFVVLLLREKRFKDTLLEIVYSVIFWVIPSFFFAGFSTLGEIINKIPEVVKNIWDDGVAYRTDIFSGIDVFFMTLGYEPLSNSSIIKYIIWIVLIISLLVCAFISKTQWKRVLALTLLVIAGPLAELESTLIFLFVPLVLCIDSEDERKAMDIVHIFLFVFVLAPIAIKDCIIDFDFNYGRELYLHSYIVSISIILFIFMLFIEIITLPFAGIELNGNKHNNK